MIVQICTGTDPGKARDNNEDSVAYDAATRLCVLADGMGGHNAGEVASGMTTAFIKTELGNWLARAGKRAEPAEIENAIVQSVGDVNRAIFNMSRGNAQYSGMGTTLVVGVFHEDGLVLGHIGDSRCYRLRDYQLEQITKDHSVQQEQADLGLIKPGSAPAAMRQNIVTRAVGVEEGALVEINQHEVEPGDVYLMCSDGLSDMVGDQTIAAILLGPDTLEEKVTRLIAAANAAGGNDNITVLLAQVKDAPRKVRLLSSARRVLRGVLQRRR
jgi:serine/threonine protein phosphatase PrpC